MKLRLLEEADVEFGAIAQWYEDQRAGLGERFISEALDAFIAIEKSHPLPSASLSIDTRPSQRKAEAFSAFNHL